LEQTVGAGSIWELAQDAIFPRGAFDAAPMQMAACLSLGGVQDDADILDLPCGPGRHSLPLARVGHRVVAVDCTARYLDAIVERREPEMSLEVVQADMREFVREDAFDLALNLYTSFGYFEDIEDDRRVLSNLRRSVRAGGSLVMDLMSREIMERAFAPARERPVSGGTLREESSLSEHGWMQSTWTLVRDGQTHAFDMSLRLYTAEQLGQALRDAGFEDVRVFGGFDRRPWDGDSARLVVVGR